MNENQNQNPNNDEIEIDLLEIFGVLWHWAWVIILVTFLFGAIGFAYSKFVMPEEFTSSTSIYILNRSSEKESQVSYQELQVGTQLTKDYSQMITSRYVLEKVNTDLQLGYTYEDFKEKVNVSTPTDTRIVTISVTELDPGMAQTIANEIRVDASDHIKNVMAIDAVNVVDEANYPTEKSGPSCSRWALIAALIGFVLSAGIVILRYILDDSIKTSEDVERYLGLSTLALIPLDEAISRNSVEQQSKHRKGSKSGRSQRKARNRREEENVSQIEQNFASDEAEDELEEPVKRETKPEAEEKLTSQETGKMDIRFHETGVLPKKEEVRAARREAEKQEKESRGKKIFGQNVLVTHTSDLDTAKVVEETENAETGRNGKAGRGVTDETIELIDL